MTDGQRTVPSEVSHYGKDLPDAAQWRRMEGEALSKRTNLPLVYHRNFPTQPQRIGL